MTVARAAVAATKWSVWRCSVVRHGYGGAARRGASVAAHGAQFLFTFLLLLEAGLVLLQVIVVVVQILPTTIIG